jgi:uroporphyrinogen-III synthase
VLELLPQTMTGQSVLFPCSERARPRLADTVTQRGGRVVALPVYTAVTQQRYTVPLYDGDCVVFTSAGTVAAFFEKHETVPDIVAWVWGERTKQALLGYFSGPIRLVTGVCG